MLAIVFFAGTLLVAQPGDDKPSRLAPIEKPPGFSLKDTSGKEVSLSSLKGKVLLVGFIFTTCSGSCPATTHRMCLVQKELDRQGLLKSGRVRLLSITLDPERDTPQKLRDYARLYDADTTSWSFLTGPTERVNKVIAAWGMWAKPAANGQLDHPSRVYLVDSKGMIREIYNLEFLRAPWVVQDIQLLLGEK